MHSGDFKNAEQWKGRKALVLGTGTSGHDVAQELQAHGADVTMIQRSRDLCRQPEGSAERLRDLFRGHSVRGLRPAGDVVSLSGAAALLSGVDRQGPRGRQGAARWRSTSAASGCDCGEDDTGFQMMYLRRGGGYYFNVGCSDLIVAGKIGLLHYHDLERIVPEGTQDH